MSFISSNLRLIYLLFTVILYTAVAQNCESILKKPQGCNKLNLCYAIDESGSISRTNFQLQSKALISITDQFSKQSPDSIYSAIGFSTSPSTVSEPTSDVEQFKSSLRNNTQLFGLTDLGKALNACAKLLESSASPRVIVLITDGVDRGQGLAAAPKLKKDGFIIATIGVGSGASGTTLPKIASSSSLYTDVSSFTTFTSNIGAIVKDLCDADEYEPPCDSVSVCFALDKTNSMTSTQSKLQIQAVQRMASQILCKAPKSTFSAAGYSRSAETIVYPTNYLRRFNYFLLRSSLDPGSASIGSGLKKCAEIIESRPPSSGTPRLIVLLTDGVDDLTPYGDDIAPGLKYSNYIIATIGVGSLTSENAIQSIASDPSLVTTVSGFYELLYQTTTISESFCKLPDPAPPTPSPTSSVSPRPLAVSTIPSLGSIPPFNPNADEGVNLEILRKNIEFYVSNEIGRGVKIRVDSELVSAASETFPWNIIEREEGERFYWVIKKSQAILKNIRKVTETIFPSFKAGNNPKCISSQCAAHVRIWSPKYIQSILIERAMNKFYRVNRYKKSFQDIFSTNTKSFTVIKRTKTDPAKYSVFLKYKKAYAPP